MAGSAVGALVIAGLSGRRGRGPGLLLGYGLGTASALLVIGGAVASSFPLVLADSAALGGANAGVFLARYAAADLAGPAARSPSCSSPTPWAPSPARTCWAPAVR